MGYQNYSNDGKATVRHLKDRARGVIRGAEEYREGGCSGPAAAILDSVCVEAAGPGWLAAPRNSSLTTALSASPPHATRREHVAGVTNTVPGALTGVWRPGRGRRGVCHRPPASPSISIRPDPKTNP